MPASHSLLRASCCRAWSQIAGCGSADDWSRPHAKPTAVGALGPGFFDPSAPPAPEATITPRPGSWDGVHPSERYRVVLLTAGEDAATTTLAAAVTDWAEQEDASLKTITATHHDQLIPSISRAIKLAPDLIISAGNDLVDPMALVTANHLDQQFLVLGAELAEPTENVTAADWDRASFRGEGLGMPPPTTRRRSPPSGPRAPSGPALPPSFTASRESWSGSISSALSRCGPRRKVGERLWSIPTVMALLEQHRAVELAR